MCAMGKTRRAQPTRFTGRRTRQRLSPALVLSSTSRPRTSPQTAARTWRRQPWVPKPPCTSASHAAAPRLGTTSDPWATRSFQATLTRGFPKWLTRIWRPSKQWRTRTRLFRPPRSRSARRWTCPCGVRVQRRLRRQTAGPTCCSHTSFAHKSPWPPSPATSVSPPTWSRLPTMWPTAHSWTPSQHCSCRSPRCLHWAPSTWTLLRLQCPCPHPRRRRQGRQQRSSRPSPCLCGLASESLFLGQRFPSSASNKHCHRQDDARSLTTEVRSNLVGRRLPMHVGVGYQKERSSSQIMWGLCMYACIYVCLAVQLATSEWQFSRILMSIMINKLDLILTREVCLSFVYQVSRLGDDDDDFSSQKSCLCRLNRHCRWTLRDYDQVAAFWAQYIIVCGHQQIGAFWEQKDFSSQMSCLL